MGIATTSYIGVKIPNDANEFLEHAHALGAGGIQANLNSLESADLRKLKDRAETLGMYIETMASLPKSAVDALLFEKNLAAARSVGALAVRVAGLSGRRYENFKSLSDWQQFVTTSIDAIKRAVPIAEKHKIPIALENHKDWTLDEIVPILKTHSSEYLGSCLDFGNNMSLLDDPMAVVEALAPYAVSTHLKDMAVEEYPEGFLLSEVPFGEGMLDLKKMVAVVREARPKTRFTLEMITRDPLQIPCLTEKYWVTFPDRSGLYLAKTMAMVRNESGRLEKLPRVGYQSETARRRLTEENNEICLHYSREQLAL